MIKTNIKMRVTPEQSKKVQEICFKNGIYWNASIRKDAIDTEGKFLYIEDTITHDVVDINNMNEVREIEQYFKECNLQEVDADLFIRTNGTCIETKQEFSYPMWFKSKASGNIIEFTGLKTGKAIYLNPLNIDPFSPVTRIVTHNWTPHTDTDSWEQIENPNEHLDRLDDIVDEAIKEVSKEEYQKPIQYRNGIDTFQRARANLSRDKLIACIQFNIDKYNWREKDQDIEDFEKIIDYAKFAIKVLKDKE